MKKTAEDLEQEKKEFEEFLADDGLDMDLDDELPSPTPVEGAQPSTQNKSDEDDTGSDEELAELERVTNGNAEDAQPEGTQPAPAATETSPETPPAAAQEPAAAGPAATPPEQAGTPPASSPAPAAAPTEQVRSAEEISEVYTNWRTTTEDLLATHHYNLSQDDLDELEAEPARFIPKLASRIYLDAVSAAIGQITQHMPAIVRAVNEQERANSETENKFFERWPKLKDHMPQVLQIGQAFRSQNPSASMDDFITNVGAMAMVSLRLDPSSPAAAQEPAKPGFVPAAQTPVGGVKQQTPERNIWDKLDEEFYSVEDLD